MDLEKHSIATLSLVSIISVINDFDDSINWIKLMYSYGQAFKKIRELKGMSRKDVSKTVPINYSTYSKIEQGRQASISILEKICQGLDIPLGYVCLLAEEIYKTEKQNEHLVNQPVGINYDNTLQKKREEDKLVSKVVLNLLSSEQKRQLQKLHANKPISKIKTHTLYKYGLIDENGQITRFGVLVALQIEGDCVENVFRDDILNRNVADKYNGQELRVLE